MEAPTPYFSSILFEGVMLHNMESDYILLLILEESPLVLGTLRQHEGSRIFSSFLSMTEVYHASRNSWKHPGLHNMELPTGKT